MQNADGQITDVITPEEHDRVEGAYTIPLYTAPLDVRKNRITEPDLLNQTCCECERSGGYALYCVDCWSKASKWQGLTDEEIVGIWEVTKPDYDDKFDFPRAIEAKLKEKNGG
jgi:hypothetical protein